MFKKLMAVILTSIMALSLFSSGVSAKQEEELRFGDDGKFTILNFSDIQDSYPLMGITKDLIKDTLKKVNPDLIILTGDNIAGYRAKTKAIAKAAINEYMEIFEKAGIKVAQVFGNHDDETTTATKDFQMDCYESYDCFIGKRGEEMTGCGTYNLPILSSDGTHYAFNLWFTDSGTYNTENDLGGYGCVGKDQIQWYINTSNKLKEDNGGKPVPSINFQHIIVPEIYDALIKNEDGSYSLPEGSKGEIHENPCPPNYSNGQFDAFIAQGDILATVCGHDHINNFEVYHKGINIINTPSVGFCSYNGTVVGSRVIILDENAPKDYETYCLGYFDIYGDNKAAKYRFELYSDTTDNATKFVALFKYVFAKIFSLFGF